jgi:hypothetical protein
MQRTAQKQIKGLSGRGKVIKLLGEGWGHSSAIEHLPSIARPWGSVLSTAKKKKKS